MSESSSGGGKRLYRSKKGQMVAGVCAGLAEYFNVDPTLVRLVWAVVSVFTVGLGVAAYLAAWVILPEEGEDTSIAETWVHKRPRSH
jgi:phage shock protein PspC (stress-responsive transcriptional regulator)